MRPGRPARGVGTARRLNRPVSAASPLILGGKKGVTALTRAAGSTAEREQGNSGDGRRQAPREQVPGTPTCPRQRRTISECCSGRRGMWKAPRRPTVRRSTPGTPDLAPAAAINLGNLLGHVGTWRAPGRPTVRRSTPGTLTLPRGGKQSRGPARSLGRCRGSQSGLPSGDRLRARRRGPHGGGQPKSLAHA